MKDDKQNALDTIKQHKNAAENIDSNLSIPAPQFNPTAQLKPEEEEEELQMKKSPFQMKVEDEEEEVQMKVKEEEEELQMKKGVDTTKASYSDSSTQTSLPENVQMKMEGSLGADFSDVNIHSNSGKAAGMGAQAYAQGNDVHFAPGKYSPESQSGQELIGHELTHVVQQRQGRVQPTTQRKGVNVNDNSSLEQEADKMGSLASKGKASQMKTNNKSARTDAPIQGNFLGDAVDWASDKIGDITNTRDNEAELDAKEDATALAAEKANFRGQNYGPITYTRGNIIGSGFEASYFPNSEVFNAVVRAKIRYADGLVDNGGTVSSPNFFMNGTQLITLLNLFPSLKSQILPYYQWGADEKEINKLRFLENIRSTMSLWQDTGMSMQVSEAGWEDVVAWPNINIDVTEGTAVHATEDYGPFGLLTRTDEAASDHLQIEMVKKPSATDAGAINGIVATFLANNVPTQFLRDMLTPPAGDALGVRAYLGNNDDSNAPEGFNNFMSLESDRSDDPQAKNFSHSVNFGHDSADVIGPQLISLETFLNDPMVLLQNPNGAVNIDLTGYASAPGSTDYNSKLVEKRITEVANIINSRMDSSSINVKTHIDPATESNLSDGPAETDLALNPLGHNDSAFRKVDIAIAQPGRGTGQNVVAHEFGHLFGLGDEYVEVGNGYNRPATGPANPGSLGDHDQLAKDAGVAAGAPIADDSRIMSTGNVVLPEHYATFADALKQLTNKQWKIIP